MLDKLNAAFGMVAPIYGSKWQGGGLSFCTTAGASLDFVDEDLRRLVVNAAIQLWAEMCRRKPMLSMSMPSTRRFSVSSTTKTITIQ